MTGGVEMWPINIVQSYRNHWRSMGIRKKLFLMFGVLVILSVGLCTTILSVYWVQKEEDSFDVYSDEITKQVSKSVDASLKNMDRLAISVAYSDVIQRILSSNYESFFPNIISVVDNNTAIWYLSNFQNSSNSVQSIFIYDNNGNLYSTPIEFRNLNYKLEQEEWLEDFANSADLVRVVGPYINHQEKLTTEPVITVARKIRDMITLDKVGYILVNVKMEALLNENLQKDWQSEADL